VIGTEMTAPAAVIATVVIEPEKRLGITISSLIREKQERNAGQTPMLLHCVGPFPSILERAFGCRCLYSFSRQMSAML
jgi:hypothetical protein